MKVIGMDKITKVQDALVIGNTLKALGESRTPFTWNVLRDAVTGNFGLTNDDSSVDMDAINQEFDSIDFDDVDIQIIAYLDTIGVAENVINDMLSAKDDYSVSACIVVADSIANQYDDDAILDTAISFANVNLDRYSLDEVEPVGRGLGRGGRGQGDMKATDGSKKVGDKTVVAEGKDGRGRDKSIVKDEEGNLKEVVEDATNMPDRKAGYKRKMVVRNGKKKWINERINKDKKVKLSPKQKLALMKARRKANTSTAKRKRAKSDKRRGNFGL